MDLTEPSWFWQWRENGGRGWEKTSQDPSADLDRLMTCHYTTKLKALVGQSTSDRDIKPFRE